MAAFLVGHVRLNVTNKVNEKDLLEQLERVKSAILSINNPHMFICEQKTFHELTIEATPPFDDGCLATLSLVQVQ